MAGRHRVCCCTVTSEECQPFIFCFNNCANVLHSSYTGGTIQMRGGWTGGCGWTSGEVVDLPAFELDIFLSTAPNGGCQWVNLTPNTECSEDGKYEIRMGCIVQDAGLIVRVTYLTNGDFFFGGTNQNTRHVQFTFINTGGGPFCTWRGGCPEVPCVVEETFDSRTGTGSQRDDVFDVLDTGTIAIT